jgi:hypothetical protein
VFFLQNGQHSAVPTADIMYRSDMEAATASILQFVLPSAEAFTERDETDARIELLPAKGTNYLLGKLGKKHFLVPPGVSVLPTNQCSKYQEAYKQMDRLYERMSGKKFISELTRGKASKRFLKFLCFLAGNSFLTC